MSYQMAGYSSIGKEFQTFDQTGRVGYCQELEFYGMDLDIYVMQPKRQLWTEIRKNLPLIGFLIVVNAILPLLLVRGFNRSFTQRISELSKVFGDSRRGTSGADFVCAWKR